MSIEKKYGDKKMIKNRNKKIVIGMFLIVLIPFMTAPIANADGWHPSAEFLHLYEPAQKAVIHWDGTTEIMVLSSAVKSKNLTDIAWVVPIISTTKPNVTAGNMSVFEILVDYFGASYWWDTPFRKLGNHDGNGNVSVVEICEIDIYDVIIVKATNASDLLDWLVENNLIVPEEAHDVIDRYVQMENCYFIINKIDLKNRFKDVIEQLENGTIPEDIWEYEQVLEDLRIGMATPLRFEFTPPEPYYPLVISSLNTGDGKIEVYVIGEKPVADVNGVMQIDRVRNMTEELKEKLQEFLPIDKEEYITRLSFNGLLEKLTNDAVFEFFTHSRDYYPVYLYISSNLENLTGNSLVDIMVYDKNGGLIELQYRVDSNGPWMVAERSDMAYIYDKWWRIFEYSAYVSETDGALWTIELDTESLSEGNHTLEIRILHKKYGRLYYSPVHLCDFTTNISAIESENLQKTNTNSLPAVLISSLVVISIVSVAVISKKTKIS